MGFFSSPPGPGPDVGSPIAAPMAPGGDIDRKIREAIRAGLPNERARLDAALFNREFYDGDFSRFPVRPPEEYEAYRYPRYSLLTQRVTNVLTEHLYRRGPARALPGHETAAGWLQSVYKAGAIDARLAASDRGALLGGFAAIEVRGTRDPDRPIAFRCWSADELVVWTDPDDQCEPHAVGVIDKFDETRRLRVWTADRVDHYRTKTLDAWQTSAGTAYHFDKSEPNHYGVIPFAFVHANFPTSTFYQAPLGSHLRVVNDWLNFNLTELGDSIRYAGRPVLTARHLPEGWTPGLLRPGKVLFLEDGSCDIAGNGPQPELAYLISNLAFIGATWEDASKYLEHSLEMVNVPPNSIRMTPSATQSGVAIVSEQIPLIRWAEGRQPSFGHSEAQLARVTLRVAAAHLKRGAAEVAELGDLRVTAEALERAADEGELALRWPSMYPDLPGQDRDRSDEWEIGQGLTSKVRVLMRRHGYTREEAIEELRGIARDQAEEQAILAELGPPPPPDPFAIAPPADDPEGGDPDLVDAEAETPEAP